jgi:GNAT superfamily N-acetyltransferase
MTQRFTSIENQEPGILSSLLSKSYADLTKSDPILWETEEISWNEFDRVVFEYAETIGACVFLSWQESELIGFGSFDPRQAPNIGIVGHNCILPEFRGQGFGKQQLDEILHRFIALGIMIAKANTIDNPFFFPAQRMYKSCGFQEVYREPWIRDKKQSLIHFQKKLIG